MDTGGTSNSYRDSDVIKLDGYKFEALGTVRDGSKSSKNKNVYEKGYHVTEACVMTKSNHPVSIYSRIHSSSEKTCTCYAAASALTVELQVPISHQAVTPNSSKEVISNILTTYIIAFI
jgi:hypothetical protein